MHLIAHTLRLASFRQLISSIVSVSLWLVFSIGFSPTALAASPVIYSIHPANLSVQPQNVIVIELSMTTDVSLAGASIHVTFSNSSYVGFESSASPAISFVDYHPAQQDVLFICNNNSCAPGTYPIAKLTVKAGQAGTATVTFTPKETADTQLNLIAADGETGRYTINSTAPATPAPASPKNSFTIPQDNGSGGMQPLQLTNDQYIDKIREAQTINESTTVQQGRSFWTPLNIFLIGLGIGAGLALFLFLLWKFFGGSGGDGPASPNTPPGTIVYSG